MSSDPDPSSAFDARDYWRSRLNRRPDLTGTGTIGLALPWQCWMYRGKERAYGHLLRRAEFRFTGCRVLDFGCGTGHFEDHWESRGAARADGIDIVPESIERLQTSYPERRYTCGDIGRDPDLLATFGEYDLVTAIDVLYHLVDDACLENALTALLARVRPGGYFLFTEGVQSGLTAQHVRFRSLDSWQIRMDQLGLQIVDRTPVFVLNNRKTRFAVSAPWLAGALCHSADAVALRLFPRRANNWALLAARVAA